MLVHCILYTVQPGVPHPSSTHLCYLPTLIDRLVWALGVSMVTGVVQKGPVLLSHCHHYTEMPLLTGQKVGQVGNPCPTFM